MRLSLSTSKRRTLETNPPSNSEGPPSPPITFSASLLALRNVSVSVIPVLVGASVDYATEAGDSEAVVNWGAKLLYPGLLNALLFVNGVKGNKQIHVGAAISEVMNDRLTVAATAQYVLSFFLSCLIFRVDTQNVDGPQGSLAALYQFDKQTSLKTKLSLKAYPTDKNADVRLAFGLSQKMSPSASATIAADLNARQVLTSFIVS